VGCYEALTILLARCLKWCVYQSERIAELTPALDQHEKVLQDAEQAKAALSQAKQELEAVRYHHPPGMLIWMRTHGEKLPVRARLCNASDSAGAASQDCVHAARDTERRRRRMGYEGGENALTFPFSRRGLRVIPVTILVPCIAQSA